MSAGIDVCGCSNVTTPFVKKCCDVMVKDTFSFAVNRQHLLFLAVCKVLHPSVDIYVISANNPSGGKIGIGDSYLNVLLSRFKIFRLHAAFHDAFGMMKSQYNIGPGYCYALSNRLPNLCFLGHITGLCYWLKIYLFNRTLFTTISV